MTITIRFFAILRDKTHTPHITMQLSKGATIAQAVEQLTVQYPAIAAHVSKIAHAVNEEYVPLTSELHDGDELALIPPVSGG